MASLDEKRRWRRNKPTTPSSGGKVVLFVTLFATIACGQSAAQAQTHDLLAGGFDVTKRVIALERIVSGGAAKDDTPAIDEPRFIPGDQAAFPADDDLVIGVVAASSAKAYPLRILAWHEIINDRLDDTPVAVTFCPLTASALVFDRRIDGQVHSFGVSGWLYENNIAFRRPKRPCKLE